MLTRGYVAHPYTVASPGRINNTGTIRVVVANSIPQTWAISRPGSWPDPVGAPFYINENAQPANRMMRGGVMPLMSARPHVEMDPSDRSTWQRDYVFS
jgi:hypothetical protein